MLKPIIIKIDFITSCLLFDKIRYSLDQIFVFFLWYRINVDFFQLNFKCVTQFVLFIPAKK